MGRARGQPLEFPTLTKLYLWANGSVGKNERPNFGASQWVTTLRVLAGRATHGQARGAVVPRVGRGPEAVDPGERVGEGVARRAALAELPIGGAAVPRLQALGVDDHHRAAQVEAGRHAEALDHPGSLQERHDQVGVALPGHDEEGEALEGHGLVATEVGQVGTHGEQQGVDALLGHGDPCTVQALGKHCVRL